MYSTASVYKYKTTRVFSPWLKKVKYKQLFKSKLPKDPVYSPFICPSYTTNPPSLTTPHDQPSPHTKRTNTIFAPLSQNPLQTHDLQNDAVSSRHHPRNNMTTLHSSSSVVIPIRSGCTRVQHANGTFRYAWVVGKTARAVQSLVCRSVGVSGHCVARDMLVCMSIWDTHVCMNECDWRFVLDYNFSSRDFP
jgi:hypothetical protein